MLVLLLVALVGGLVMARATRERRALVPVPVRIRP